jgi:hypothetical protein
MLLLYQSVQGPGTGLCDARYGDSGPAGLGDPEVIPRRNRAAGVQARVGIPVKCPVPG